MSQADPVAPAAPSAALALLVEGNWRFVASERRHPHQDAERRTALARTQQPFAVLFGCSDSRLAAEIIFDQGLGDLFVVRTAGHVIGPEVLGSIEYALVHLDVPLIAVLGHDSCGAIAAAFDAMHRGTVPGGFMSDVVERVMLGLLPVRYQAVTDPTEAAKGHVRYTVKSLVQRSAVIAERLADGRCGVVGLFYRLAKGSVQPVVAHGV